MIETPDSAIEQLKRGQARLASAANDPEKLGLALYALHGALETHLRDILAENLPDDCNDILDPAVVKWKGLLELAEDNLGLSKADSNFISQANRYRNDFAHKTRFTWDREGVCRYEELIRELWTALSLGYAAPQVKVSEPKSQPRVKAAPKAEAEIPPLPLRQETAAPKFKYEFRPWYRSTGFYWFLFLLLLPVWGIMILTDRQRGWLVKGLAVGVFALYLAGGYFLWTNRGLLPSLPSLLPAPVIEPTQTVTAEPTTAPLPTKTPPRATQPVQAVQPTDTDTVEGGCRLAWVETPGSDLAGKNRSMAWAENVRPQVEGSGMLANDFYKQVMEQNPSLAADGYIFSADKTYLLPRCE